MRKIIDPRGLHNLRCRVWLPPLLALAALAGCSRAGDGGEDATDRARGTADTADCAVVVDTTAWGQFIVLADRMAAGQAVPLAERQAWAESPPVAAWRQSLAPHVPRVRNMANWLEGAWRAELGLEGRPKANADRAALGRSYRYSRDRAEIIRPLLGSFQSGPRACAVLTLADRWIPAAALPPSLRLVFLPAIPELRIDAGDVFVDTGVLAAGGGDQTVRQIASLLYRNLGSATGPNPIETDGDTAVVAVFRVMMNEGIAAHIEGTSRIVFDQKHPKLRRVHIVPEDFFRKAQRTVQICDEILPDLLAGGSPPEGAGNDFARQMAAANAFTANGIAMAEVIVFRHGEDELRRVCRSLPDFLASYQAAALENPVPAPVPGMPGVPLATTVRPLAPEVYAALHGLVMRHGTATP